MAALYHAFLYSLPHQSPNLFVYHLGLCRTNPPHHPDTLTSTPQPILDGILGVSLIIHSHIGFDSCIVDYLHERKFPIVGKIMPWLLRIGTGLSVWGVYEFNTNDIGESGDSVQDTGCRVQAREDYLGSMGGCEIPDGLVSIRFRFCFYLRCHHSTFSPFHLRATAIKEKRGICWTCRSYRGRDLAKTDDRTELTSRSHRADQARLDSLKPLWSSESRSSSRDGYRAVIRPVKPRAFGRGGQGLSLHDMGSFGCLYSTLYHTFRCSLIHHMAGIRVDETVMIT